MSFLVTYLYYVSSVWILITYISLIYVYIYLNLYVDRVWVLIIMIMIIIIFQIFYYSIINKSLKFRFKSLTHQKTHIIVGKIVLIQ